MLSKRKPVTQTDTRVDTDTRTVTPRINPLRIATPQTDTRTGTPHTDTRTGTPHTDTRTGTPKTDTYANIKRGIITNIGTPNTSNRMNV